MKIEQAIDTKKIKKTRKIINYPQGEMPDKNILQMLLIQPFP
jgi:hypothetical protein